MKEEKAVKRVDIEAINKRTRQEKVSIGFKLV